MIEHVNQTSLTAIHWLTEWPEQKLTVVAKCVLDLAGAPIADDVAFDSADLVPVKRKTDVLVRTSAAGKHRVVVGSTRIDAPSIEAFEPLALDHPERMSKLGTYDQRWLDERWPWYPTDFDIGFFNSAPKALQIDEPSGDEKIAFDATVTQLPRLRMRMFVQRAGAFEELTVRLDTIALDVDAGQLSLTWRSFGDAPDVTHVYLASEPLADEPLTAAQHQERFQLALLRRESTAKARRSESANDNEPDATEAEDLAQLRASMVQMDAPPEILAVIDGASTMKQALAALTDMIDGDPAQVDEMMKTATAMMKEQLAAAGEDPSVLDLDDQPDDAPLVWSRKRVQACAKGGESMAGADLRGLDLSSLDLTDAVLTDALLAKVDLSKTKLYGANLDGVTMPDAELRDAVLGNATLVDADLTGCRAAGIDLRHANLEGALFDGCAMPNALFDEAKGMGASFQGADLTAARFFRSDMSNALFDEAIIHGANFDEAVLVDASLQAVRGDDVVFTRANMFRTRLGEAASLFRADLRHAKANESIWFGADLREAKFTLGELRRADFSGAKLDRVALDGANCADADFTASVLLGASMLGANFAGACFTRADLSRADARKANFYEAELWQANTKGTRLDEAHLAMTKLAPKAPPS